MHELALMREIVRLVKGRLDASGSQARIVRLRVAAHSHLAGGGEGAARLAFALAAQGTPLADARLEITPAPTAAVCRACGLRAEWDGAARPCPACGAAALAVEPALEVVVQEIVVDE
ncbi:hydrogenase/urease maturation nickel metallochaperone HypA [Nitrospira sp. Kam-Ns4a]